MKHSFLFTLLLAGLNAVAFAQHATTDQNKPRKTITDESIAANQKVLWSRDTVYVLSGFVYVEEGAELTIQAGTVIKAREGTASNASALIISRGAKIYAEGTATQPIIFTTVLDSVALQDTPEAGDNVDYKSDRSKWGGVVILGRAQNNVGANVLVEGLPDDARARYGGTADDDNSGVFRFVSIKYSGTVIESNLSFRALRWLRLVAERPWNTLSRSTPVMMVSSSSAET